jgi:hypothetical protein
MKPLLVIVAVVVGLVLLYFLVRSRVVVPSSLAVGQIPTAVAQLRAAGKNASFAVFMFAPQGTPANDNTTVNLQYSIEGGVVGLDWVLLAPKNIADKDAVAEFISSRGHSVLQREGNNVRYLRVESGDIQELGVQIADEFYHLGRDAKINLITEGFEWKP